MVEVAFAGAGGSGFTSAALVSSLGHHATIWSPSGRGITGLLQGKKLVASGYVNGEFAVTPVEGPRPLLQAADIVQVTVPAYAHKPIADQLVPLLEDRHIVVLAGAPMGGGAIYLSRQLAAAGKKTRVALMNGPMIGGRKTSDHEAATSPYRSMVPVVGVPTDTTPGIHAALETVFGERFNTPQSGDALELSLRSVNAVVHAALILCNITRVEEGLPWCGYGQTTESVGNLTDALDADRVAVAKGFGYAIAGVRQHFDPKGLAKSTQDAIQPIMYQRSFRNGPMKISTRYIEEELPFGLTMLELLGKKVGVATPMITNILDVFNATRAKNYRAMNPFIDELGLRDASAEDIRKLWNTGGRA